VSDRLAGQRATREREEGRVISITIYGKVRLYIPLYNYIVITQGSWRKGLKTAVSLQTPAVWAGVCKSNILTIVKEWGEWRGGSLSGWLEISQYISRTLGVVFIVL
jgi:hypothetical protein